MRRSTGRATAGHLGPAAGTRYIVCVRAKASCLRAPVSSTLGVTTHPHPSVDSMPKQPEPGTQQGLVVFAKNKKRVSAFYAQTLDLNAEESSPSHELLRGHGYEVVIHAIPRRYASEIKLTRPPQPREDTPFKPTFVVASLEAVRLAAVATGGHLKPAEAAWHFRGCSVIDGWDPEGNVVQFKQRDA